MVRLISDPLLGSCEILSSEEGAAVPLLDMPLAGAYKEAGMGVQPLQVCVKGVDQGLDCCFEVVLITKEDPVGDRQVLTHVTGIDVDAKDGDFACCWQSRR